jgi:hypothetical protein
LGGIKLFDGLLIKLFLDSGGPLVTGGNVQIGILSWGVLPCGGGFPDGKINFLSKSPLDIKSISLQVSIVWLTSELGF